MHLLQVVLPVHGRYVEVQLFALLRWYRRV